VRFTSYGVPDHLYGLFGTIEQIRLRLVLYVAIFAIGTYKEIGLMQPILVLATCRCNMPGPAKAFQELQLINPRSTFRATRVSSFASSYQYAHFVRDVGVRNSRKLGLV